MKDWHEMVLEHGISINEGSWVKKTTQTCLNLSPILISQY
jgi:hypothetical protein